MKRLLKYFLVSVVIMSLVSLPAFMFFLEWKQALISSVIAGTVFGFFCSGFMQRTLKSETLTINASNKDPQKSLRWYEDEIRTILFSFRYEKLTNEKGIEEYRPFGLYRVFEPHVILEINPYEINLTASRLVCRIVSDLLRPAAYGSE